MRARNNNNIIIVIVHRAVGVVAAAARRHTFLFNIILLTLCAPADRSTLRPAAAAPHAGQLQNIRGSTDARRQWANAFCIVSTRVCNNNNTRTSSNIGEHVAHLI